MALNTTDRLAILPLLLTRIEGIVSDKALYILGLQSATQPEKDWALTAVRDTKAMAQRVSKFIANDPEFVANGSGISDAALSTAVGTAVDSHFVVE